MRFPFQRNELEIVYAALAKGHLSNGARSANEMLSWLPDDAGDWAIIVGTLALCYRYLLDGSAGGADRRGGSGGE